MFVPVSLVASALVTASHAGPAVFTLDTPTSALELSGTIAGATLQSQGTGSLRTTYFGDFRLSLSPDAVQFVAGGTATANNSGSWQPLADGLAGSAPANYGGRVTISFITTNVAVRDLTADASSDPIPLNPDLTFNAAAANVNVLTGNVAYRSILSSGSNSLAGSAGPNAGAGNGTLVINRNAALATATAVAQVPVAATVVGTIDLIGPATINFDGGFRGSVSSIYGDTDFDRVVDIGDFSTLAANFNSPGSWLAGDFEGDGTVGIGDFSQLAANFNRKAPGALPRGAAVPEPVSTLLPLVALTLAARRRRG
jgi:hypothetical protein